VIHFDIDQINKRIDQISELMLDEGFWSDRKRAKKLIDEQNKFKDITVSYKETVLAVTNFVESLLLLKEEYDQELHQLLSDEYLGTLKMVEKFEIKVLLTGSLDNHNAILEFHPGAGGVDSQDWAMMLYRMYVRYAQKNNFTVDIIDYQAGEEAGIKSVVLIIKGNNAYGYLKAEKGVHRLVRISPFDASGRRHTSFASVDVIPEFSDDINLNINESELRIDTYRAGGAGGQHVNKTDSAVRITHIPTNIVVSCQSERSQIQNKERAMNMLKSKLYQLLLDQKKEELAEIRGEQKSIEWGSQIRSYVMCPYNLVKDHRSDYETSDVNGVLDGDLDDIIYSCLIKGVK
jgi:peptide chain release factor 2